MTTVNQNALPFQWVFFEAMDLKNDNLDREVNNALGRVATLFSAFTLLRSIWDTGKLVYAIYTKAFPLSLVAVGIQAGRLLVTYIILFAVLPVIAEKINKQ